MQKINSYMELEDLYNEVLNEGVITDWIKQHSDVVRQLVKELTLMGLVGGSPIVMAAYVNKFLQNNPEVLQYGNRFIEKIASFIANNPQVLDIVKA